MAGVWWSEQGVVRFWREVLRILLAVVIILVVRASDIWAALGRQPTRRVKVAGRLRYLFRRSTSTGKSSTCC